MRILDNLRVLKIYLGLIRDPNRTELVFDAVKIATKYKDDPLAQEVIGRVMSNDEFRNRFEERYLPPWPSLEQLRECPEGSFGQAVYRHMVMNGLDLELFPRVEPHDEIDYLNARAYQDHDLWHALLGYGTEVEDELAIQAFNVAQFRSPLGILLISGGLLHMLIFHPGKAVDAIAKISEGYRRGQKAKFLLGMKLVEMLPQPLRP